MLSEEPSQAALMAEKAKLLSIPHAKSNLSYVIMSGMTSGVVEGIVMQPLEFLKTRLQIDTTGGMTLMGTLRGALKEGGVMQLYRGSLPEIAGMLPRSTAALGSLELTKRGLMRISTSQDGKLKVWQAYVAGATSGVFESIGFAPFQVIKVRMASAEHLHRYKNSLDCVRQVLKEEGAQALVLGLGPTLWRVVTWNALYYGTMAQLQKVYLDPNPMGNVALEAARKLSLGVLVGMGATVFNAPFDVVKSRVQAQLPGKVKYGATWPSLATIVREEGFMALYRGFLPKAMRLGLGQTIGYMVFSETLKHLEATEAQA